MSIFKNTINRGGTYIRYHPEAKAGTVIVSFTRKPSDKHLADVLVFVEGLYLTIFVWADHMQVRVSGKALTVLVGGDVVFYMHTKGSYYQLLGEPWTLGMMYEMQGRSNAEYLRDRVREPDKGWLRFDDEVLKWKKIWT